MSSDCESTRDVAFSVLRALTLLRSTWISWPPRRLISQTTAILDLDLTNDAFLDRLVASLPSALTWWRQCRNLEA